LKWTILFRVPLLSPFPLALSPLPEFDVEPLDSFGIILIGMFLIGNGKEPPNLGLFDDS
jgi:hypothetical protein